MLKLYPGLLNETVMSHLKIVDKKMDKKGKAVFFILNFYFEPCIIITLKFIFII